MSDQQRKWMKQRIKLLMQNRKSHAEIMEALNISSIYLDTLIAELRKEAAPHEQVRFATSL